MTNNFDSNKNPLLKNNTLKNMLDRLSEQAKQRFGGESEITSNNKDHKEKESIHHFNDFEFFGKNNFKPELKEHVANYDNFTQEFFMERYKQFIPSKYITPTDFRNESELIEVVQGNNITIEKFSDNLKNFNENMQLFHIIKSKIQLKDFEFKLKNLNLESWIRMHNELNDGISININSDRDATVFILKLENFFNRYSLNVLAKPFIISEVSEIKLIDCLQILTIKDFNLETKDILITKADETLSTGIIDNLVNDDQFTIGEVIIIKNSRMKELNIGENKINIISLSNVKQL